MINASRVVSILSTAIIAMLVPPPFAAGAEGLPAQPQNEAISAVPAAAAPATAPANPGAGEVAQPSSSNTNPEPAGTAAFGAPLDEHTKATPPDPSQTLSATGRSYLESIREQRRALVKRRSKNAREAMQERRMLMDPWAEARREAAENRSAVIRETFKNRSEWARQAWENRRRWMDPYGESLRSWGETHRATERGEVETRGDSMEQPAFGPDPMAAPAYGDGLWTFRPH